MACVILQISDCFSINAMTRLIRTKCSHHIKVNRFILIIISEPKCAENIFTSILLFMLAN